MSPSSLTYTGRDNEVTPTLSPWFRNTVSTDYTYPIRKRRRTMGSTSFSGSFDRGNKHAEVKKKVEARRKTKQIADEKSKKGLQKTNFRVNLSTQKSKQPMWDNHKMNSNRGG